MAEFENLKKAGLELQKLMGMDPEFKESFSEEEAISWLKVTTGKDGKGNDYIDVKIDRFTPETIAVIKEFRPDLELLQKEEIPTKDPEGNYTTESLEAEVKGAERLRDLKDIATEYDEFKGLRGKLSSYKSPEELKKVMLEVLASPPTPSGKKQVPIPEKKASAPKQKEKDVPSTEVKESGQDTPTTNLEPKKEPAQKEQTMAHFIDSVLLAGGTWEEMLGKCVAEATKRGYKIPINRSALNTHLKYRLAKNADYLGKLKVTETGIHE